MNKYGQDADNMLKLLALGQAEIDRGDVVPMKKAFNSIRQRMNKK